MLASSTNAQKLRHAYMYNQSSKYKRTKERGGFVLFFIKWKTLLKIFRELSHPSDHVKHEHVCLVTIMFLLRTQVREKEPTAVNIY